MRAHSKFLITCLIITTGCLGAGYILAGYWLILPLLLVSFLIGFITRKRAVFWSASGLLLTFVILAAIGITIGLSLTLMIIAGSAALASWEVILFTEHAATPRVDATRRSLENRHLRSLVLATIAGLAIALISASINLHFSFGLAVLLVLIFIECLIFSVTYIKKQNS